MKRRDKDVLNHIYDKVAGLINKNFQPNSEYARVKDLAYREVLRILTGELNK